MYIIKKKVPRRTKHGTKEYRYYYLVRNVWKDGQPRIEHIAYLGKKPIITPERLAALQQAGLDPHQLEKVKGLRVLR